MSAAYQFEVWSAFRTASVRCFIGRTIVGRTMRPRHQRPAPCAAIAFSSSSGAVASRTLNLFQTLSGLHRWYRPSRPSALLGGVTKLEDMTRRVSAELRHRKSTIAAPLTWHGAANACFR
jgi:hypothetical protein